MTENLSAQIEALLFRDGQPYGIQELANICAANPEAVQKAVSSLANNLENRGLTLVRNDGTVQLVADKAFNDLIQTAHKREVDTDLTTAQSEALSVVAYLQPVTKPIVDFIRGVNSRTVLRNLVTRGLIAKETKDSQTQYTLTNQTLTHLGLNNPQDLPDYESTRQQLTKFVRTHKEDNQ